MRPGGCGLSWHTSAFEALPCDADLNPNRSFGTASVKWTLSSPNLPCLAFHDFLPHRRKRRFSVTFLAARYKPARHHFGLIGTATWRTRSSSFTFCHRPMPLLPGFATLTAKRDAPLLWRSKQRQQQRPERHHIPHSVPPPPCRCSCRSFPAHTSTGWKLHPHHHIRGLRQQREADEHPSHQRP